MSDDVEIDDDPCPKCTADHTYRSDCMNLTELANKYGTDKGTTVGAAHGYTTIYERYLEPMRGQPVHLLEIGVAGGASIRMWRDYFPKAHITGIDHNTQFVKDFINATLKEGNQDRLSILDLDVTNPKTWDFLHLESLDVVVDDGGHYSSQIQAAFEGAWSLLKSGGLYFIEDIHAIYQHDPGMNFFPWIESLVHRELNEHGRNQCGRQTFGEFEYVHFYKSLCIIKKR